MIYLYIYIYTRHILQTLQMFYAAPWIHQGIYGLNLVLGVAMCWGGWASNVIHPHPLQRH